MSTNNPDAITRFTLPNGLRVIHRRDAATAMVAVAVMYDVGSRDETPALTGIAHLMEHLMFGGSPNAPDFDGELSAAGGMSNAWTSSDFTCFYNVVPAVNIDTALWLESDRMKAMATTPHGLQVQKSVVIEEFKQTCLNRPYGKCDHAMRALAFPDHPYGHPVIGLDFSHIERATLADVAQWHALHYAPGNAVLAVCGNITAEALRRKAEHWFADVPARPVAVRSIVPAAPVEAPRSVALTDDVPATMLQLAWPMAAYGEPGYYAADIITDILANGNDSRFYRNLLLGTDLFSEVDAAIWGTERPGLLTVNAKLNGRGPEAEQAAVAAIIGQLDALRSRPVAERELQRCVNRLEASKAFSQMSYTATAMALATAEMHGEDPDRTLAPYHLLTPDSIMAAARQIFNPDRRLTLICRTNS